jgi:endo-1,4-beta-mannosidase
MPPFRIGINYWPARTAMAMWTNFDPQAIEQDFARIAAAGLRSVRLFLLWEVFQPDEDRIDREALLKLERTLELLRAHRLQAMPTLFCGHMSGVNWLPRWTLDRGAPSGRFRTISAGVVEPWRIANFYARGPLLDAQRFAVRTIGSHFRGNETIEAWDLGNEFSNLAIPSSVGEGLAWSETLSRELLRASSLPVTGGLHGEDVDQDRNIRPSAMCAPWQFATIHGYSAYASFARDRLDPEVVPFYYDLVASFSNKRVLVSEFGNPQCPQGPNLSGFPCLNENEMATYAAEVLERLLRRGALGAYWWCYTDYDARLRNMPPFDRAPHELYFGAWRADGSPKPVVSILSRFARAAPDVSGAPPADLIESDYYDPPMHVKEMYAEYLRRVKAA